MKTSECSTYLIINNSGRDYEIPKLCITSCRKNKPSLSKNQVAIKITLSLPDQYFQDNCPHAKIEVPEGALINPEIEIDVPCAEENESEPGNA